MMRKNPERRMNIEEYLRTHFVEKNVYAAQAGVSLERLNELIDLRAIPCATYICNGTSICTAVFGLIEIEETLHGEFFRPECVRWARLAHQAPPGMERATVLTELQAELARALLESHASNDAVQKRVDAYLPYFFDGTFGLCVSDPSSGSGIARKEMLQEKLVDATANGSNPASSPYSTNMLLELIDEYAESSMPFSPAEYARSSRKRLVDDLREKIAAAGNT
jgi:hypothetical protein